MTAPGQPTEIVEAAAHAIFAQEQCDKRQAKDVPYQWNTRLNEADHEEYRDLARAALAAAWPLIAAHVLNAAADDIDHDLAAVQDKPIDDSAWDRYDAMTVLTKWLRESAAAQIPEELK